MGNGYSICFNEWALDKSINGELGLLLIISSLCAEKGYCFASNDYFAELFNEHETTISRKIKKLFKKKYIIVEYEKRGAEIKSRKIRLANLLTDDYQNCYSTISENAKDNIISINNIKEIDNNKLLSTKKRKFVPPTLEEVETYCKERNNNVDAKRFYDYYEANDWVDGKGNKVISWKQKMISSWETNTKNQQSNQIKEELPDWFDKNIEKQEISKEEQQEFDDLINSFS